MSTAIPDSRTPEHCTGELAARAPGLHSTPIERRSWHAPAADRGTLVDPPASELGELLAHNRFLAGEQASISLSGKSLAAVSAAARAELLEAARRYTLSYRDVNERLRTLPADAPLLVAGHQPQLFHPGVWYKNFLLGRTAAEQQAIGINLVIDSDTAKTAIVRVPGGSAAEPIVEPVPLDRATAEIAFEERPIVDRDCLASFATRAADVLRPLIDAPLLPEFWPKVIARGQAQPLLGAALAQARHQQEAEWGNQTLELPQSEVCELPSFHWFAAWLLSRPDCVRTVYNQAVADYRQANGVRSSAHPVPDLAADGEYIEAPFWIWHASDPRRRRLFVARQGQQVTLTDRHQLQIQLPLSPDADLSAAVQQLAGFRSQGLRLRTRALITTLFARLCLGDLFFHGIGGAKYDEVTDQLMRRLFGLTPLAYVTATATLRLPIPHRVTPDDAVRQAEHYLRELSYHPEHAFDNGPPPPAEACRWIEQKRRWLAIEPTKTNAKERCQAIRAANTALQTWLSDRRVEATGQRDQAVVDLRHESVLSSREYGFPLYPGEALRSLFGV